jgi:hypothetical protein
LERDFKQVEATRDQLAAEFFATYPKVVAELVDLLSRTSDCDPKCSRIDRAATAGERRRLRAVELHACRLKLAEIGERIDGEPRRRQLRRTRGNSSPQYGKTRTHRSHTIFQQGQRRLGSDPVRSIDTLYQHSQTLTRHVLPRAAHLRLKMRVKSKMYMLGHEATRRSRIASFGIISR